MGERWNPLTKLSEIMAAGTAPITVYGAGPFGDDIKMRIGTRYRIATEEMNVLCSVVGINHGAERPLHLMYLTEHGDSLLGWFSPDDLLWVRAL